MISCIHHNEIEVYFYPFLTYLSSKIPKKVGMEELGKGALYLETKIGEKKKLSFFLKWSLLLLPISQVQLELTVGKRLFSEILSQFADLHPVFSQFFFSGTCFFSVWGFFKTVLLYYLALTWGTLKVKLACPCK